MSRLTGVLSGIDAETFTPSTEDEARGAIASVADYCDRVCPVRLACPEDACRLYRVEGRALEVLGLRRNPATEAVGVLGQATTGLG